jgi:hypothetical protein
MWDSPTVLASYQPRYVSPPRPRAEPVASFRPGAVGSLSATTAVADAPSRLAVEDRLLQARRDYDAKREHRRLDAAAKEVEGLRFRPEISARSAALVQPAVPVYERLAAVSSAAKLAHVSVPYDVREALMVVPQPTINERSLKMPARGAEGFAKWDRERRARMAARAKRNEADVASAVTGTPLLNPRSRSLATRRRDAAGLSDRPVEDELLAWEQTRQRRQREQADARAEELRRRSLDDTTSTFTFNGRAAAERLFEDARAREEERERKLLEAELLGCIDPVTGQVLYEPRTTRGTVYPESRRPLTSPLRSARAPLTAEPAHEPRISEYSRVLADIRKERAGEAHVPTVDRLSAPKPVEVVLPPPPSSFTPRIDSNSRVLDRRRVLTPTQTHRTAPTSVGQPQQRTRTPEASSRREDLLLDKQRQYDAHRERLEKQRRIAELAACTWAPRTNTPRTNEVHHASVSTFVERQERWEARRVAKLENQRSSEADAATADCTFHPNTGIRTTPLFH